MLLLLLLVTSAASAPVSLPPETLPGVRAGPIVPRAAAAPAYRATVLRSVERRSSGDFLVPALCPSACPQLFHAEFAKQESECACVCPKDRPVYLNSAGRCVSRIEDCPRPVSFSNASLDFVDVSSEYHIPVVSLQPGIIAPQLEIQWAEAGVGVSGGVADCSVSSVSSDGAGHRWIPLNAHAFSIAQHANRSVVEYTLSAETTLEGQVVQLKLACTGVKETLCLAMRIEGQSVSPVSPVVSTDTRMEAILLVICIGIVLLVIVASFIIWQVCWRLKKQRLIGEIQAQFLYHIKQQQDIHKAAAAHLYGNGEGGEGGAGGQNGHSAPQIVQKRRLFFSADFLEPSALVHPPPMAQQFLFDLRRMIDMARDRCKMKRHIQTMESIAEEGSEEYENYMEAEVPPLCPATRPESLHIAQAISVEASVDSAPTDSAHARNASDESPRSGKSVDSGRASAPEDASESSDSDTSSEGAETKGAGLEISPAARRAAVNTIINGLEQRAAMPKIQGGKPPIPVKPTNIPRPSQIPAPRTLGSASPRTSPRQLSLQGLPRTPPPQVPPTAFRSGEVETRSDRRKGYSVFPSEPLFNKSLPRRPKRVIDAE